MTLQLDEADVRSVLRLEGLIPEMRRAMIALSAGEVDQPVRASIPVEDHGGFLFWMPARLGASMGVKIVTLYPPNADKGIPTHLATIFLLNPETGEPLAILDGRLITEMRTSAVSAAATDALAAPNAPVLALLGTGVQARSHAEAIPLVRKIEEIRVWGRTPSHAEACAEEIGGRVAATVEEAVRDADIICTVTNAREPFLEGRWLKPGAHINAVGAPRYNWRELDDEVMSHIVVVDKREAAMKEAGDVILSGAEIYAEIGEIFGGAKPAPVDRITVFKSLGQAVQDIVSARMVYENAMNSVG